MPTLLKRPKNQPAIIALLLVFVIATLFWTQSRYPALDEKAMMSGAIQLEDPLSFEAKFLVNPDMPLAKKIGLSTLNWYYTNKQGMTFGILLGAAFLTFFGYLRRRSFANPFLNSLLGMAIGAPLGVCVNCAAPIAKGMYAAGMRAETTLSMMIASPTLNVIVLTLLISLMPFYMVLMKLVLSVAMILVLVPLICRLLPQQQLMQIPVPATGNWDDFANDQPRQSLFSAVYDVVKAFFRNLWFIVKTTVPLMLLAGLLGAAVATMLPPGLLQNLGFSLSLLVGVVVIGTFLPVPIAFDVVLAGTLLSAGMAPGYVMALLFTLGIFSVYSYFIVAQAISNRAALLMGATVVVLGLGAGLAAQNYHKWQSDRALELLLGGLTALSPVGAAMAQDASQITVTATPFAAKSPAAEKPFTRLEGWDIGIEKPIEFSFRDMWPPFWEARSLASGDIDRDGDLDLVMASTWVGLYVLLNNGTGRFTSALPKLGNLANAPVFNAALVDVDNDGWLDIFLTTYLSGNHILRNVEGVFDVANLTPVRNRDAAVLTLALSFGDLDRDGDLDAALGNWAAGWYRRIPGEESRNRIVFNDAGQMDGSKFTDLSTPPGETLSILFSDINGDGNLDLIEGNDFDIPDGFFRGDGAGGLTPITYADQIIPHTTTTTMAVKVADLHNDGVPEIYLAQIAGRSSGVSDTLKMQNLDIYCAGIKNPGDRATCEKNMAIKTWYKSGNNFDPAYAAKCQTLSGRDQSECKAMLIKDLAIQRRDPAVCKLIPKAQRFAQAACTIHFWPSRSVTAAEAEASIPQILRSNVLLTRDQGAASFTDRAEAEGLDVGGWSWDTKIADFDNDGYQDVYIVNGTWVPNEVSPSNLFFHNQGDGTFTEASGPFGLEDYLMTAAATLIDLEGDGDLDIISQPVNGPVTVFKNNVQTGNAIAFEFDDGIGNRFGVGAKVMIQTADGTRQTRELQLGGGFMSFDAPRLYFGLGNNQRIERGTITWIDGEVTEIGQLTAGSMYKITRR